MRETTPFRCSAADPAHRQSYNKVFLSDVKKLSKLTTINVPPPWKYIYIYNLFIFSWKNLAKTYYMMAVYTSSRGMCRTWQEQLYLNFFYKTQPLHLEYAKPGKTRVSIERQKHHGLPRRELCDVQNCMDSPGQIKFHA